jgi:hypothetical protein
MYNLHMIDKPKKQKECREKETTHASLLLLPISLLYATLFPSSPHHLFPSPPFSDRHSGGVLLLLQQISKKESNGLRPL